MFIFKYVYVNTGKESQTSLSCLQKLLIPWFWVQKLVSPAAILPQKSMPSQARHIYFVYFGHDAKILKIACLTWGCAWWWNPIQF